MQAKESRNDRRNPDDAVDEAIRRKFRACRTLPLFSDPSPHGFFEPSSIGPQLHLLDLALSRGRD